MSTKNSKDKPIRIGLIIIVLILVFLGGIQVFFRFYLDSYVENRLTSAVSEQTNGQYELKVDDLNLSVWGRNLEMQNIRLQPADSASTAPAIDLKKLSISSIQFFSWLFSGEIYVGKIHLSDLNFTLTQDSPDSLTFLQSSDHSGNKKQPVIEVEHFIIDNGSVTYRKPDQNEARGSVQNFNLDISDVRIDSITRAEIPYFKFGGIEMASGEIRYEFNNGLYTLETNGMNLSTTETYMSVESLKLIPKYPRYEFTEHIGHQLDRITLTIEQLLFENPDFEKLNSGELKAEKFTIQNANLDVFHSKLLPSGPKRKQVFPHMAFKNLSFPVTIDTIAVIQAGISYSEHLPDVSRPGTVRFANIHGTFTDVTNDSVAISNGHEIVLEVTSNVMNEALLDAHFVFPMHKNGDHSVRGTLESVAAEKFNPVLEPVGLVRFEKGTIHSLNFQMDFGPQASSGWVQLEYSDLNLEVLDEKNVEDGGSQFFKTLLANLLKVKKNNIEKPLRKGKVSFEHVEDKSIFNYWWKSLSSGLKDNIGI